MKKNAPKSSSSFDPAVQYGLLAGFVCTILLFSVVMGGGLAAVLSSLALAPLLLVGWLYGVKSCAIACGVAFVGALGILSPVGAFVYGLNSILPALGLMWVSHTFTKAGRISAMLWHGLLTYGALMLVLGFALFGRQTDAIIKQLSTSPMMHMAADPQFALIVRGIVSMMPALLALSFVMGATVNVWITHKIAQKAGKPVAALPSLMDFKGERYDYVLLGLTIALSSFASGDFKMLCLNVALYEAFVFLISGVVLIHRFCAKKSNRIFLLMVFYGLMGVFAPLSLIIIMLGGLIRPWLLERFSVFDNV